VTHEGQGVDTSASLLDRLAASPSDADWRRLFGLYAPLLEGWLARAGVPAHDRDDLSQEVLLVVVREVAGFGRRHPGAFRGWLRAVLLNRVRDYFRGRANRAVAAGGSAACERLDELADPASLLSQLWDREHDEQVAAQAMARARVDFTETTWAAFTRQVLEGRPAGEAAAELGISRNAVLVAKSRVLARIRAEVAGLID
jgi:RNA polymerase sigma-70 factor (ECF subfamily)